MLKLSTGLGHATTDEYTENAERDIFLLDAPASPLSSSS